ncbi:ATP-dependent DNA helicase [Microbacterium mangrovi]|uniref:DNA 3'-5' helicase n=1 Tax=Microbacterium mangrovi TaxID=1348253 RepID=A0A0B2A750_9MICO|nr:ATP-dependent DNA helicase [Microbacterium mangrovi]KHK97377.1 ATP-dependent DNA helicase [Microbacterium mangrovi]
MTDAVLPRTALIAPEVIAAALGQPSPTSEQSAVIAAPLGPALVVAGAGSGKTETMAGRVVWLIANRLVERDEVLGLTFTRKAAGELAERLQRRLARWSQLERRGLVPHLARLHDEGRLAELAEASASEAERAAVLDRLATAVEAEPAASDPDSLLRRPTVMTYNSFADGIVRENAVRIGRDAESAVLSESAAWLLMRRVVFASDDPRLEERPNALSTIIDAALRIARDGVDNLCDFDALERFPLEFARVREIPSTSARTTVYADIARGADAVDGLMVLTALAREYDAHKRRLGVIDFTDQVAGAIEIVRSHPSVAEEIRQQYRVVLLDEYQDTSVVQTSLLAALFADTAVMAVGDPHQAIYGWRGASAGNLGDFAGAFCADPDDCRQYSLLTSWRNSRLVLTAANAVLAPLDPPVPVGELRPRPGAGDGVVDIASCADLDEEAAAVADWFAHVRAERASAGRSTTGAVLFRNKKHMVRFGDALAARGVPHRILGLGGLLSTPEVVDVVSALRVISDPSAGSALIRLLAGPRWAIGLADLRQLEKLSRRIAAHDSTGRQLDPDIAERVRTSADADRGSLIDALDFMLRRDDAHAWLRGFTAAARERLRDAAAVFAALRQAAGLPIADLVRLVEQELRLDIELAANEARGPARTAGAQLRAFVDEVHAFLAADDSGSLSSLLAWLDHAEQLDEFAPRTEPPEDDVVQLLTIHGSKGLEWDAVAVVRMVEDELPTGAKGKSGWLSFGVLPTVFRGDSAWLPEFAWRDAQTQQELKAALDRYQEENRAKQLDEERRLAYVAVTRARDHLLLSASPWSGTTRPRATSRFLQEVADALGTPREDAETGENPYDGERRTLTWPLDPLGVRRPAVVAAAARAQDALTAPRVSADDDLALLLAEREARKAAASGSAPVRIPASRYKDFVTDYEGTIAAIERPMPERPYRETRLGTLFHAWVEQRSGMVGSSATLDEALWEQDDELFAPENGVASRPGTSAEARTDTGGEHDALRRLQAAFEKSEWASLKPLEVETEIDFRFEGVGGGAHVAICKLDAVYRRGDRIEIVDWKTGAPPSSASDREARLLQLQLYRRAYHAKHGVPLDQIDVALYYVAHDLVIRD